MFYESYEPSLFDHGTAAKVKALYVPAVKNVCLILVWLEFENRPLQKNIYYKVSKIRLNGLHIISENGIYCFM